MADTYSNNMTRGASETKRLDDQFDLMAENIGYILHPSITLPSAPHICDMGTGTARFLVRLQPMYPDGTLEGFDISSALYPPKDALPPNVVLSELDVKQPFLEHMHGKYDLVHVRMLVAAMMPGDWERVIQNLMKILKPGGFIQWIECDFVTGEYLGSKPTSRIKTLESLGKAFRATLGEQFAHGWNTLPDIMRAAGLTSVFTDIKPSDRVPETREKITEGIQSLVISWAHLMVKRGASETEMFGDTLDNVEKEVRDEIKSGCYFKYNIHVTCGRRAPV
ncbi:hypothetical protein F5B19DRAFT_440645 [Rostrohypoxylon terebratum]|nr:hypothetical protein F5B19DRAFT_440645 [Rostrohypoxylon terebratum]